MHSDQQIIFPTQIAVPEEAFEFLKHLQDSMSSQLGLKDIVGLNGKSYRTATSAGIEHTDTMDKISDQMRQRMGTHGFRR